MPTDPEFTDPDYTGSVAETLGRIMARLNVAEDDVTSLSDDINGNSTDIVAVRARVNSCETNIAALQATVTTLQTRLNLVNGLLHLW